MQNEDSEDEPLAAFMTGRPCLPVEIDNRINRNLFYGRAIHLTIELMEPLSAPGGPTSEQLDTSIRRMAHLAQNETVSHTDVKVSAQLLPLWYDIELTLLGRSPNTQWLEEAEQALSWFLAYDTEGVTPGAVPNVVNLARYKPIDFISWVDESGSGGPSAELLCFMNPFWRRAGFIYFSPFDGVMRLRREQIESPFSVGANLRGRGLLPPLSI